MAGESVGWRDVEGWMERVRGRDVGGWLEKVGNGGWLERRVGMEGFERMAGESEGWKDVGGWLEKEWDGGMLKDGWSK